MERAFLPLVLARGPGGLSLRQTSGWASLSGTAELSNPGVHYRLKQSASFVEAVVERLLLDKLPGGDLRWPDRRLCLADGTSISRPGSMGTDWRVHGVFDPGRGGFSHLELTDAHGAEALDRGAAMPGGVIRIGDRNYARAVVLKRFLADSDGTADFIVSVGWNALRFKTTNGNIFDLIDHLRNLSVDMEPYEQPLHAVACRDPVAALPLRLIVRRKTPEATRLALRRNAAKKGKTLDPRSLAAAEFMILATSLPAHGYTADAIMTSIGSAGKSNSLLNN